MSYFNDTTGIRKLCYKEHAGTAKSTEFLFKSILL